MPGMGTIAGSVFGAYAAPVKLRLFGGIAALVVTLDLSTKAAALAYLEEGLVLRVLDRNLELSIAFNRTAMGSSLTAQAAEMGMDWVFGVTLLQAVLCALALPWASALLPTWRKALLMLGLGVTAEAAGLWVGTAFGGHPGDATFSLLRVFAVAVSSVLLFRLPRTKVGFSLVSLMIAASLSNAINILVYPRGVVDFVFVPALAWLLGQANVADYILEFSGIMLVLWALAVGVLRLAMFVPALGRTPLSVLHRTLAAPLERTPLPTALEPSAISHTRLSDWNGSTSPK